MEAGDLKHKIPAVLDNEAGQPPGCVGTGIDVDPIRPDVGLADRGVAVDDDLPEVVLASKKIIADPE
jgi:hypothetical protein